jgi:hypothetical protein
VSVSTRAHLDVAEVQLANAERHFTEHPADMRIADVAAAVGLLHAVLGLVPLVREVGDQLDTIPRVAPTTEPVVEREPTPLYDAAVLLEGIAVGADGKLREETLARLVMHHRWPYKDAAQIARHAIDDAGPRAGLVLSAVYALGITPALHMTTSASDIGPVDA